MERPDFFPVAAAIVNPAYLEREIAREDVRRRAASREQRAGVRISGMEAPDYHPRSPEDLQAAAIRAEAAQRAFDASPEGRAVRAVQRAEDALQAMAGALSAFVAARSRAQGIDETARQRLVEAATIATALAPVLNAAATDAGLAVAS